MPHSRLLSQESDSEDATEIPEPDDESSCPRSCLAIGLLSWALALMILFLTVKPATRSEAGLDRDQSCRPLKEHAHVNSSFTEGFTADGASWLESSGSWQHSKLLRLDANGQVLAWQDLKKGLFGEGIALLHGLVYQLTWREDTILVYNASTLSEIGRAMGVLSQLNRQEGWGLTTDGRVLIASDGSDNIYFLDPRNFSLESTLRVEGKQPDGERIWSINELEFTHGLLFFNVWYKDWIGVFDLQKRSIVQWLNCSALVKQQKDLQPGADVLNGIAFKPVQLEGAHFLRMVITGKFWDRMYEINYNLPTQR